MPDVTMSEDDRETLRRLARRVDELEAALPDARTARNKLMHALFNGYRADVTEIAEVTGMKRQSVHPIVRGPRTRRKHHADLPTDNNVVFVPVDGAADEW